MRSVLSSQFPLPWLHASHVVARPRHTQRRCQRHCSTLPVTLDTHRTVATLNDPKKNPTQCATKVTLKLLRTTHARKRLQLRHHALATRLHTLHSRHIRAAVVVVVRVAAKSRPGRHSHTHTHISLAVRSRSVTVFVLRPSSRRPHSSTRHAQTTTLWRKKEQKTRAQKLRRVFRRCCVAVAVGTHTHTCFFIRLARQNSDTQTLSLSSLLS